MDLTRLKEAKKRENLTIATIAERANLPKGTVQNIFCGYVPNPRSDTLEAIERALGLTSSEWATKEHTSNDEQLTQEEQTLLNNFRSLPRQERAQAIEYVQYLADKRGSKNKHA